MTFLYIVEFDRQNITKYLQIHSFGSLIIIMGKIFSQPADPTFFLFIYYLYAIKNVDYHSNNRSNKIWKIFSFGEFICFDVRLRTKFY